MPTQKGNEDIRGQIAALRELLIDDQASELTRDPALADAVTKALDDMLAKVADAADAAPTAADAGFAQLIGLGADAATDLGQTRAPLRVSEYDETVTPERISAVGDLYYIYQHETIGVFRVMQKLKELFEAGTLRLSDGLGAFRLYQFDKREALRYTRRDRLAAYRRVLGYGGAPVPPGATPNTVFHSLYVNFVNEVIQFWRDKRVSEVMRDRPDDASFGSIAMVRRAGLDLRNNLKSTSYGHVNVLRVEVMQLLDESFRILESDDVKRQFGSENAWDVIEEVLTRYFHQTLSTSPRQRMAVTGREILQWIARKFILETTRPEFEGNLRDIAEDAEEWMTSAETVGVAQRRGPEERAMAWNRRTTGPGGRTNSRPVRRPDYRAREPAREYESEF
jgi:hypothetical protein